ncbi:hypothetical protein [Sphingomonas segetis]|jgi:acyl-CoA synthetase (AMP-forming)/AMP-acid ligase II|uniref:hypothetical protein n=1 Tax=Sphingomonas segetis TaxID=1104779 RepID=UPI0012D2CD7C|nr:hypothetical protein [Sphingomonas segetis]
MGPAYFVIAILGCADGGSACTPVATLQTRYVTEAQCTASAGAALMDNSNFDFPTLVAQCRVEEPRAAEARDRPRDKPRRG